MTAEAPTHFECAWCVPISKRDPLASHTICELHLELETPEPIDLPACEEPGCDNGEVLWVKHVPPCINGGGACPCGGTYAPCEECEGRGTVEEAECDRCDHTFAVGDLFKHAWTWKGKAREQKLCASCHRRETLEDAGLCTACGKRPPKDPVRGIVPVTATCDDCAFEVCLDCAEYTGDQEIPAYRCVSCGGDAS